MEPYRKNQLRLLLILSGLLAIGLLLRGPVMGVVRNWRYDANVKKAEQSLAEDDLVSANRFASAAMRLKPRDLEALRTLMELGTRIRSGDLPAVALARFTHEDATLDDQVAVLEYGLATGDLVFFSKLHESLDQERRAEAAVQFCYADYLERSGRVLDAIELVNDLTFSPRGPEAKFRLVRLLAGMEDNPVAYKRMRELLLELMQAGDRKALAAFRHLQRLPPRERALSGGPNLQSWVEGEEDALPSDHLLAAEIALASAGPAERSGIVDTVMSRFRDRHPRELARWLLRVGESDRVLELPEDILRADESFYTAYLQVLIDQGRYDDTREWIAKPHPKLSGLLIDAVRAGLAFAQRDEPQRVHYWQRGFEKAKFHGSYGSWIAMLEVAGRFGDEEMVRKISSEIMEMPPRSLPPTQQLEFLIHEFGADPAGLEAFFVRLEATRPEDPLARHHLAQIRIVRGLNLGPAVSTLVDLTQVYDEILTFQCSLALGYLAQGKVQEAYGLLSTREANWNETGSYERAVYALVSRRAGEERVAQSLEETIQWERLPVYLREFLRAK